MLDTAAARPAADTRAALREAVTKHQATELTLSKLVAALEKASEDRLDAQMAIERAQEVARKATEIDADSVVAAALAGTPLSPRASQRQAREALTEAQEVAEQARALVDVLERKIEETRRSLNLQAMTVQSAVTAHVKACSAKAISAFVTDTTRMQAELVARMRAMQLLVGQGILEDSASRHIGRFFSYEPQLWKIDTSQTADIAGRWEATIDRLTRDAGAPAELK